MKSVSRLRARRSLLPRPLREEPQAGGYLRGAEELARQCDDAVHQAGLDQVLSDITLAGLVRRHGAVGQDEARRAARRKVVQEMLHPCEVGVAHGRNAVLPPPVVAQPLAAPVGDVEWRISEDVVGPQVGVSIVVEAVSVLDTALDATDRKVHPRHAPGRVVRLLAVDGDVAPSTRPRSRCRWHGPG